MISISAKLGAADGRPSGFDYLRISLALSVLAIHTASTCYGEPGIHFIWGTALRGPCKMILPMFFALSGFLVAGSLERTRTLPVFLGLRAIRIYPALIVEIVLSAVVLGPIFTSLPLQAYFSHPLFWRYLLNVSGEISYYLPGVFDATPDNTVNAQLWTVPFELYCYISLAVLVLIGIRKRPSTIVYFLAATVLVSLLYNWHHMHGRWYEIRKSVPGFSLVSAFATGVVIYLYRHRLAWSPAGAIGCALASLLAFQFVPGSDFLAVIPTAYLTVFLGLTTPPRSVVLDHADYSYGIFLYGFPIQQAVAAQGAWARHWYISLPLSTLITAAFAMLSWRFVEKPALRLRKPLMRWEDRRLARGAEPERSDVVHAVGRQLAAADHEEGLHRPPARQV